MKSAALALAALLATTQVARADEPIAPVEIDVPASLLRHVVADPLQPRLYELARARGAQGRALRNTGIAHVVIGTLLTGVGVGLFVSGICLDSCSKPDSLWQTGSALLTLGQGAVFSGIPMWAVGQYRATRADQVVLTLGATGARLIF